MGCGGIGGAIMVFLGIIFFTIPDLLSAIYASDPRITAVAVPTLLVAAFVLLPDGVQAVLMGALRGSADVWPATALYFISFWLVMVPCGYYLGITRAAARRHSCRPSSSAACWRHYCWDGAFTPCPNTTWAEPDPDLKFLATNGF